MKSGDLSDILNVRTYPSTAMGVIMTFGRSDFDWPELDRRPDDLDYYDSPYEGDDDYAEPTLGPAVLLSGREVEVSFLDALLEWDDDFVVMSEQERMYLQPWYDREKFLQALQEIDESLDEAFEALTPPARKKNRVARRLGQKYGFKLFEKSSPECTGGHDYSTGHKSYRNNGQKPRKPWFK